MSKKSKKTRKPKTLDDFKRKPKKQKTTKVPKREKKEALSGPPPEHDPAPYPENILDEPEPTPSYQEMPPEPEPTPSYQEMPPEPEPTPYPELDLDELYERKRSPETLAGKAASTSIDWTDPIKKAEQYKKDLSVSFEVSAKNKWSPDEWAFHLSKRIQEDYRFMAISKRSHLWVYQEEIGIWTEGGPELIHTELIRLMKQRYSLRVGRTVEDRIRGSNYVSPDIIGGPVHKMVFENGIYDFFKHKFYDKFEPDEYHITRVPMTYDPDDHNCPIFQQFLEDVVQWGKDELTGKADMDAVMEFFGLCLHKGNPTPKIMAFHGKTHTGKSTILEILEELLGEENCSDITPQQLAERYMEAQLRGKLANIASDIPTSQILITRVNRATGGDMSEVREIYKAPFKQRPFAKWIFSANSLPKIAGTSKEIDAFCKRVCTIEFKHEFSSKIPKYIIVDSVMREKSAILNLALEGYKRLEENNFVFSGEKTLDDKREVWLVESDSAELFREECVVINPLAKRMSKNWWHKMYQQWCIARGIEPTSLRVFNRRLKELIPEADGTQQEGPAEKRYRVWSNIEFTGFDAYDEPPDSY